MPLHGTLPCHRSDSVRIAGPADESALYDLMVASVAEHGLFTFDEKKAHEWAYVVTHHPEGGAHCVVGVIDGNDGELAGCAGLIMRQADYSSDWYLSNQLIYVRPEYRRSRCGALLLNFCRKIADQFGMRLVIDVISTKRIAAKARFFASIGEPCGAAFLYEGAQ